MWTDWTHLTTGTGRFKFVDIAEQKTKADTSFTVKVQVEL